MLARRHDDAEPRAVGDVDMRIDAALADELELRQSFEQRRADLRALANEHQRLGIGESRGERIGVLNVIVPDRDLMPGKPVETGQRPHGVVVVVEDGDFHWLERPSIG